MAKAPKNENSKNIVNSIDLAKIPVKETARRLIDANFGDGEKQYWIRALNDADRMCISMLHTGQRDVQRPIDLYVIILTAGLEALNEDQEAARFLVKNVTEEAQRVGNIIYDLTTEFYRLKDKEAEQAEKNLPETAGNTEATEATLL